MQNQILLVYAKNLKSIFFISEGTGLKQRQYKTVFYVK